MEEFFYILQKVKNSRINLEKDEEYLLMMPELFRKVCRLCLSETDNLQPVSVPRQNKPNYSCLILNLMDIDLESDNDDFHSMICEECASNLTLFYKFREKIETNNDTLARLKSMIDRIKHPFKVEWDKQSSVDVHGDDEEIEVLTTIQEDYTASVADESVDQMKEEPMADEEAEESEFLDPSWCDDASNTKIEVIKPSDNGDGYTCLICERTFDEPDRLERHMAKRHSPEEEVAYEQETINEEATTQADVEFYENICEEIEMIDEQHLNEIQKQTAIEVTESVKRTTTTRHLKHRCPLCRHAFDGPKKLARHMATHEESYKGRRFAHPVELEVLNEEEETTEESNNRETKPKKYSCPVCNLPIDTPSKLKKHMLTHAPKAEEEDATNTFVCTVCYCAFPTVEYLDAHEKQHDLKSRQYRRPPINFESPKQRLLCELCGRNFLNRSSFILHLPQHTGEKPFKCELCDIRFTRKHHVKIHMRTHEDIKPFSCEICGMAFTKSGNLNRHLAVHSSDRNYRCEICGKAFKRKNDLPKHMITHTGERNFKCGTCNKSYTSRSGLVKHWKHHPDPSAIPTSRILLIGPENSDTPVYEPCVVEESQLTILGK